MDPDIDYARRIVDVLEAGRHRGRDRAMKARILARAIGIVEPKGERRTRGHVRDAVERKLAFIVGSRSGYYLAETPEDFDPYLRTLRRLAIRTLQRRKWGQELRADVARKQRVGTETGLLFELERSER